MIVPLQFQLWAFPGLYKLYTPGFWQVPAFFMADLLKFNRIRWGVSVNFSSFTRSLMKVKSGLWSDHARTFRSVLKLLYPHLGCMLWVVVVLKGDPLTQSKGSLRFCTELKAFIFQFWPFSFSMPLRSAPQHDASLEEQYYHYRPHQTRPAFLASYWFWPDVQLKEESSVWTDFCYESE